MIGMSNGMNVGDETALRKKHHTEQQDKRIDLMIYKYERYKVFYPSNNERYSCLKPVK
jgi:hypothetical protein